LFSASVCPACALTFRIAFGSFTVIE
jgi:hypothetical protein